MRSAIRLVLLVLAATPPAQAQSPAGYYRQPAIHGSTVVFVAEGDLWKVADTGGVATRLTTHPGDESHPAISPDGRTLAFVATYEGPPEVYTMPLEGGLPTRRTYGSRSPRVVGWTPDGRVIYATNRYATLPDHQLVLLDPSSSTGAGDEQRVPLAQAADGWYEADGRTLYFTRFRFQGSHTRRYKGGTAQNLWKYVDGSDEAVPLTADYPGTSKRPMGWRGRIYFASDRSGAMNLWSMTPDGGDLRQHTRHEGWEVKSPGLHEGRIVYQLGADIRLYDVAEDRDRVVPIRLSSDLDQMREHWVDKPLEYLDAVHLSGDGRRIVLTARGRVFVAPRKQGRLVEVTRQEGVRYRKATFLPGSEFLVALSDASGEVELWKLPARGVGQPERLTDDGTVLRWDVLPSPDGRYVAHHDKDQRLWVLEVATGRNREIDRNSVGDFDELAWSPDGRWLAYRARADNAFEQIKVYGVDSGQTAAVTTDRFDSYAPAWSPDGQWLYFLSDRNLKSIVGSPWGSYQPEPFMDKTTGIYLIALTAGLRSPWAPRDELHAGDDEQADGANDANSETGKKGKGKRDHEQRPRDVRVAIEREGIARRLLRVPIDPGNYTDLSVNGDALYWRSRNAGDDHWNLSAAKIARDEVKVETVVEAIDDYELSGDGAKLLVQKGDELYVMEAAPKKAELAEARVDLSDWSLSVVPREEWRQMFVDAWRLERDYFYDRGMHGVDWKAMRDKYAPLVDRVTTRDELNDLVAQMVSELAALHIFVRGGDQRSGKLDVEPASLGAVLRRDESAGGWRVEHVWRSDPDEPDRASPLARPGVDVAEGDVIETINGTSTLSVPHPRALLRDKAGQQVLLRVRREGAKARDVIVEPISADREADLRYHEWQFTRRREVERRGAGEIGYVHLRAMGGRNWTEWATSFYPVFTRKGLIIDVRHNRGGNIDSWILGRLLRRPWFYWSQREGRSPTWNMQYAFRGHVVVLCDAFTASDGEAFTEGVRRLGIGTIVGTRTWGGEIWLTSSNRLVDRGIATAAEFGVFSPEGEWLIEGHGVEPDVVVDNLPRQTFAGRDAQLEAAIELLQRKIVEDPVELPDVPPHPDKSRRP